MNRTYRRFDLWPEDGLTQLLLFFSSKLSFDLSSDANRRHREDNQCGEQEQDQSSARDAEAEGSCTVTLHGHFFFFAELSRCECLSFCGACQSAGGKRVCKELQKKSERAKVFETTRLKRPGKVPRKRGQQ